MKKVLTFSVFGLILFSSYSCLKKNTDTGCPYRDSQVKAPAAEVQKLEEYLTSKGIEATKDSSGLYYIIGAPGTDTVDATVCSYVAVNYTGKLTTDVVFDKTDGTPATFILGGLIPGFIKGIQHIKAGGKIRLYIPPSLAYGSAGSARRDQNNNIVYVVPPDSILIFDIELIKVQQL